ncbi:bile acid:sodium symporter family protein [Polaromonas sp. P1-6]|nr:bile acid:sodium symporter family protein [Polaromonas sp. P1-6]
MNGAPIVTQLLVVALALVMFGLGLSLSTQDFTRLLKHPKAVMVALALQIIVLPLACYGLIVALKVPPLFAVGLMLLAASPGGISANLFSHLFGGNVAMNISLTAVNTVLSIITLPLISNWAIQHFANTGQVVPLQFGKVVEVIAIVLVPVCIGMWVRTLTPGFAARAEKPMKVFSAVVLAVVAIGALVKEWQALSTTFAAVGPAVVAFNLVSLLAGYYLSRQRPGQSHGHGHQLRNQHPQLDAGHFHCAGGAEQLPARAAGRHLFGQHVPHGHAVRGCWCSGAPAHPRKVVPKLPRQARSL